MLQGVVVDVEDRGKELEVLILLDLKDVVADQLVHEVLSELGSYLQGIYSKREEHLDDPVYVLLVIVCDQLGLMLLHHRFSD